MLLNHKSVLGSIQTLIHVNGLDCRILTRMVSVDEKYLCQCFELVHNCALKASHWNIPMNLRATNIVTLLESLNSA